MPRDRHRTQDTTKDDDQFIILVKDIPRHCRWQELKDLTRNYGGEHSLKAEVFELRDGSQMGHCTIKGRIAANQVYEQFCNHGWNGQCVCVSLAVLEKPGVLKTLQGPRRSQGSLEVKRPGNGNGNGNFVGASAAVHPAPSHTSHYTGLNNPAGPLPCGAQYRSMNPSGGHAAMPPITSGRMPHLSYTYAGHPQSLSYQSTASYGPVQALHPYRLPTSSNKPAVSGSRTPHKAKSGSSVAEFASRTGNDSTTILLSGLPSSQSEAELRSLLRCYGAVIYLEIPPESRNPGKCKGTARVRYETLSEALKAVRALDGASLSNRKICVKQIRDGAAVSSSSPPPSSSTPSSARHDAKRTVVETKKVSVSAPPLREHNSSQAAHNIPLSSSAPPKLSSTQRASSARNRGSTGNAATSPIGPLVVNGATYSRRLSQGNSDASDDSSEEDSVQSEEGSSDHEQEEEEHGTNAPANRATARMRRLRVDRQS